MPVIPAPVEQLRDALLQAAAPEPRSLVLFGSHARGDARPHSDVNLLVVLEDTSAATLRRLAGPLKQAQREARVVPLVISRAELAQVAEVFPVKFLEMKAHHLVVHGEDPLTGLSVQRDHLRLRVEQELRNLLLRLRRAYLAAADDPTALARAVWQAASALRVQLWGLLLAHGHERDADDVTAIFDAAAERWQLDRSTLTQLAALRAGDTAAEEALADATLLLLERVAQAADAALEAA